MKRRDALSLLSALAGGTLVGSPLLLSGCQAEETITYRFFTEQEIALLEQVAETILPATPQSPGAKAVNIGAFMDIYVADCLEPAGQEVLRNGLKLLDLRCQEEDGKAFMKLSQIQQNNILLALDFEAEAYQKQAEPAAPPHYFTLLKGLALLGYFTSEPGATEALRYVPVPGKYEGDIPYEKGEKAWAI